MVRSTISPDFNEIFDGSGRKARSIRSPLSDITYLARLHLIIDCKRSILYGVTYSGTVKFFAILSGTPT